MNDQRICPRWNIGLRGLAILHCENLIIECRVIDINFKGLRILLNRELKDSIVDLTVILPNELIFTFQANVAWHGQSDNLNLYGLTFHKISDEDKEKIYQFVQKSFRQELNKHIWQGFFNKDDNGVGNKEIFPVKENFLGRTIDSKDENDRRAYERFSAQLPLKISNPDNNKEDRGQTCDISVEGISFTTNKNALVGDVVDVGLEMPGRDAVFHAKARVVWLKQILSGLNKVGVSLAAV